MNKTLSIGMIVVAMAAGCSSAKKTSTASVTEPLSPEPVAYQPAPQPYTPPPTAAQPVVYDSNPSPVASSAGTSIASGSYTVKHGDTLYSIARSRYGNGKEYTKIVSANPGLDPSKLRVGQTITIP